jgi:hypothetical protein
MQQQSNGAKGGGLCIPTDQGIYKDFINHHMCRCQNMITAELSNGCGGGVAVPMVVAYVPQQTWVLTIIFSSTELMLILCPIHYIPYVEINSE